MGAIFVRGLRFALCSRGCPVTNLALLRTLQPIADEVYRIAGAGGVRNAQLRGQRQPFGRCRQLACVRSVRGLGFIYSYSSSTRGWRLLRPAHGRTDDDDDNDSACSQTYQPTRRARGRESLWEVEYDENWGKVSSPPILLDTSAAMPLHWLFRQSCNARNATLFVFLIVTVQVMN